MQRRPTKFGGRNNQKSGAGHRGGPMVSIAARLKAWARSNAPMVGAAQDKIMKMKIKYCPLLLLALLAPSLFAQPMNSAMAPPPSTNAPPPDKTKLNVMIGSSFGRNIGNADIKDMLDYDIILKAMKDQVEGKPEMTETELREVSREFSAYMRAKQQVKALAMK